jgi:hypothetical protein
MNKSETREAQKIQQYCAAGLGNDYAARALSALIRAARTNKSAAALRALAAQMGVTQHPEFIC